MSVSVCVYIYYIHILYTHIYIYIYLFIHIVLIGMSKPALQDMILFPFHSILGALFAAGVHHRACAECIYVHRKGPY